MHQRASITTAIIAFMLSVVCLGQSLGDLAREERARHAGNPPRKVITDDDIVHQSDSSTSRQDVVVPKSQSGDQDYANSAAEKLKEAERFKSAIQWQKRNVTAMQMSLARLKASTFAMQPGAVHFNEEQLRNQQQAELLQKQLEEEKAKLEELQEQARRAGFGSALYE